jgi:Ca2+-binding RTX toxin-like protein
MRGLARKACLPAPFAEGLGRVSPGKRTIGLAPSADRCALALGGADILIGGSDDSPDGGAGLDRLLGQAGSDTMAGGSERGVFVFTANSGADIITDYQENFDVLRFNGLGFSFGDLTIGDDGADLVIETLDADMIRLPGQAGTVLDATDCVFA